MRFVLCFIITLIFFTPAHAGTPQELYKWKDFLVKGEKKFHCVPEFNDDKKFHCTWPGILNLEIYENKIIFKQKITLFTDTFIKLPGSSQNFPVKVKTNNSSIPVTLKNNTPVCFPGKGDFTVSGEITYNEIPDFINLPDFSGGFNIFSKTNKVKHPYTDSKNILWLKKVNKDAAKNKEHIRVKVFRKIKDSYPCEIESVYKINISGSSRQEKINTGNILGKISSVKSPLPLKIEENGSFHIQAKPGEYEISLKNIIPFMPLQLGPFNSGYGKEIIVLEKEPGVRISNIKNLKSIDPKNTDIPDSWKSFLTYILPENEKIIFEEKIKGVLNQGPELKLEREIWLDFDGKGATIKDKIRGNFFQRQFLGISKDSGIIPGKISVNNKDQIITQKNNLYGVPVNEENIEIESVSRKENLPQSFKTGWNTDFSNISGYINIPPAFGLLSVSGAKLKGSHTFISKWTLLDIFVLCILFISALKIWNIKWGIVFFVCAGALYHKFYLPPYVWIFLVVCSGILNSVSLKKFFLQKGFFRFCFYTLYFSCLLAVFCSAVIFSAQSIKYFVYPSLDSPYQSRRIYPSFEVKQQKPQLSDNFMRETSADLKKRIYSKGKTIDMEIDKPIYQTSADDNIYTQTGAGIPSWKNKRIGFENGDPDKINIRVIPPFAVRTLYLANVFFLFILLLKLIPFKKIFKGLKPLPASNKTAVIVIFLLFFGFLPQKGFSSQYPPQHLLNEYKNRLLKEKDFDYSLALIENCELNASKSGKKINLEMIFNINAARDCAVFLPDTKDLEYKKIYLDSKEHDFILKNLNKTLTFIPKGIHELKISSVSKDNEIELEFKMMPVKLSFNPEKVESKGIEEKGFSPLIKIFIPEQTAEKSSLQGIEGITPFPVVERSLYLGREWKIRTIVKRFYPQNNDKKAEVSIPLLKNEKILKETSDIKNNRLDITLMPETKFYEFESEIPLGQNIEIISDKNMFHIQKWHIESDSLTDFEVKGLLPVKYKNTEKTVFVLEPGINAAIIPKSLEPLKGRFFTIDNARLIYDISKTKNTLTLNSSIRAGKGVNHSIFYDSSRIYPEKITINNVKGQIPQTNGELSVLLSPGTNKINIVFNEKNKKQSFFLPGKINFPEIDFNSEASNITQKIIYPSKSWIIAAFGPRKGPAVLFWGYFAGVVFAALAAAKFIKSFLKPHQFILLAAGLSLAAPLEIIIVFGFFFAVEYRRNLVPENTKYFNLIQTGIIFLLIMSAMIIYDAVSSGLLGIPDMQIAGNGSYSGNLNWFLDRTEKNPASIFIILAPINLWKLILFLWSIWISAFLINKTPYIIDSLKHEGFWKKSKFFKKKNKEINP
jgi:hypothetical protein